MQGMERQTEPMPLANLFLGTLYDPTHNGVNWSQPGGPGTPVFPQQQVATPFLAYPVVGQVWAENSGLWSVGCGHWVNLPEVIRAFDNESGESAALICCPMCSFIQSIIEPYQDALDATLNPILII